MSNKKLDEIIQRHSSRITDRVAYCYACEQKQPCDVNVVLSLVDGLGNKKEK